MYGYILAGEVIGTGLGFVLADVASALAGWRAALGIVSIVSIPSLAVVFLLTHTLREPVRGGITRLQPIAASQAPGPSASDRHGPEVVARRWRRTIPHRGRFGSMSTAFPASPLAALSPWAAVRYALAVPTNALLVVSSSFGYFYLNGLRTFAVLFLRGQYGLNQWVATVVVLLVGVGVLAGVLFGGRTPIA
jgi:predicted MFS family arabinose efflux permease